MIPYPRIDPVIIKIGPLALRWYGLMYLLGFLASLLLVKMQIREECPNAADVKDQERVLEGLLMALIAGVILGGRLGYVLFYNLAYFEAHPAEILATWHGGMSFHGGAIGALAAGYIYCRRHSTDFF
jgi:phosphatidylglycerol:prolipoprotein diacylglycerol transferase